MGSGTGMLSVGRRRASGADAGAGAAGERVSSSPFIEELSRERGGRSLVRMGSSFFLRLSLCRSAWDWKLNLLWCRPKPAAWRDESRDLEERVGVSYERRPPMVRLANGGLGRTELEIMQVVPVGGGHARVALVGVVVVPPLVVGALVKGRHEAAVVAARRGDGLERPPAPRHVAVM
jgi:hypothetical protein